MRRRARTPRGKVSDRQLRRWAEAAIKAAAPDRFEHLERQVESLARALRMASIAMATYAETVLKGESLSDIACPCCGVRFDAESILDHVDNPPSWCDRVGWQNAMHGPVELLRGRDNR